MSYKETISQLTPEEIEGSLAVMQAVFRQVGPRIVEHAGKMAHVDKKDGSPVTAMDVEVEKIVQAKLARQYPDLLVFGEETGYGKELPPAVWLVDPIDGTQSFIDNVPTFTSMAVLIQDKEAIAAVIYNPSTDEMYVAQKDRGAYKNGVRLELDKLPLPRIAWCKERFFDAINPLLAPAGVSCEKGPSGAGNGFALVADGRVAARFNLHGGGYVHDYAPGALLVREAGGALVPIMNDDYTYDTFSFVACHPQLEPILRAEVAKLRELESKPRQ